MCQLLIERGAQKDLRTNSGRTPLDLAKNLEVASFLRKLNKRKLEEDLNCKLCNRWLRYTAPDQASLKDHYRTLHPESKQY